MICYVICLIDLLTVNCYMIEYYVRRVVWTRVCPDMHRCSMFCYVMYAFMLICMLVMLWAGRQYVMGRKALRFGPEDDMFWTGRSWPGRAYMWLVYRGYLTKLSGLQLWFYVFRFSGVCGKAKA